MSGRLIAPPGAQPQTPGEREIVALLVRDLPGDEYIVLPNVLILSRNGQRLEYDVVVVAPHGVYALEIKDWSGPISGDEREWNVRGRWGPSPIGGIEHKAKVLKSVISDGKPVLGRVRVEGAVVLAFPPDALDLSPGARRSVRLKSELVEFLTDPAAIGRAPGDIRTLDSVIVNEIAGRRVADRGPVRFGQYQVRETVEESEAEAWFVGFRPEMRALPDVLLRVVPDSPYLLNPQEREAARRSLYREMEAVIAAGPHPNVVPVRDVLEVEGALVAVLDAAGGMSLRHRLAAPPALTVEQRMSVVLGVLRGLDHLHSHGVVHRAVSPETILLDAHMQPRLTRFGHAKLASEASATVWPDANLAPSAYRAPEVGTSPHEATGAADIFSLGVLAQELVGIGVGQRHPTAVGSTPELAGLQAILPRLLSVVPSERPTATEVLEAVMPAPEALSPPADGTAQYRPGDVIDDQFEVRSLLGTGGFSSVYRVYRALDDRDYALKVFNSTASFETVQRELTMLRAVHHPHVVEVVWASRTAGGQWYIVSEYVEGQSLAPYAYGEKALSPREVVELIDQLLDALATMHPDVERARELEAMSRESDLTEEQYEELQRAKQGVIHRDVKPGNLLLTPEGIMLIDFNISSSAGSRVVTLAGTPRYQPREADYTTWNVYPDLFATGVVAYELLCHKHPFEDNAPGVDPVPVDPRSYRPELTDAMASWLIQACAPSRDAHFSSAKEMRSALRAVGVPIRTAEPPMASLPVSVDAPANSNPYVAMFLEMASQARRSNTGTRGLTDLARQTYVSTRLDEDLAAAIVGGTVRLAVVTGNAGDGKTAFIQMLEEDLLAKGASRTSAQPNGSELRIGERSLVTLYDGSQDESDQSSDEVLDRFFTRILSRAGDAGTAGLIAVNEGRLRDFSLSHGASYPALMALVGELDAPGALADPSLALVNLNLRSVTAGGADSILSRQLRQVVRGPFWDACAGCDWRTRCPIKHNVDTLADSTSGELAVERLRVLVDVVRLRRRRHLTLRDLRSLISFVLFRDRTCEEIAVLAESDEQSERLLDLLYFQALGGMGVPEESTLDRGAALLREIDVALVSNPNLDRQLQIDSGPRRASFEGRDADLGANLIARARADLPQAYLGDGAPHRRTHQAHRRLMFFERGDDGWIDMLPYKRLGDFQRAVHELEAREQLKIDLLSAISASEGAVPEGASSDNLRLANGTGDSGIRAFRQFPSSEFDLRVPRVGARYVESEPDCLELVHVPSGTVLVVDLDLLEVLEQLRRGHVASAEERRGFMLSLALFRNRLLVEPARQLVLEHDGLSYELAREARGSVRLKAAGA